MSEEQDRLTEKAEAAFRAIVPVVIQRARQTGTPIVVWRDGHIHELPPDEFEKTLGEASTYPPLT